MVAPLLCLIACLLPVVGLAAELEIRLSEPQVEMGKFLKVEIIYEGETDPGGPELGLWDTDFHVDARNRESEPLASGAIRSTLALRLYPRAVGEKVLDRIALGGAVAGPLRLRVVPSVRDDIDITPQWLPVPQRVWQGQAFEIGVDLPLAHPSNRVAAEDPALDEFEVQALPPVYREHAKTALIALRWRLVARQAGHFSIELPAIEQRGRGRWRYYLRSPLVAVRPLPAYLPPGVPVGLLEMQTGLVRSDGERFWEVTVANRGPLPEAVYGLRSALAERARRDPETVQIAPVELDSATGIHRQRYRVAVPDWSLGWGRGPLLTLLYFDVLQGRLLRLQGRLPAVWQVSRPLALALMAFAAAVLAGLLVIFWRAWRRLRAIRLFRGRLRQAADAHELRRLLLESGGYRTLNEWSASQPDPTAAGLAQELNSVCFSATQGPLSAHLRRAVSKITM